VPDRHGTPPSVGRSGDTAGLRPNGGSARGHVGSACPRHTRARRAGGARHLTGSRGRTGPGMLDAGRTTGDQPDRRSSGSLRHPWRRPGPAATRGAGPRPASDCRRASGLIRRRAACRTPSLLMTGKRSRRTWPDASGAVSPPRRRGWERTTPEVATQSYGGGMAPRSRDDLQSPRASFPRMSVLVCPASPKEEM